MPFQVGANISGERQEIQQRNGQTTFQSRGEAEAFRDELRRGGFDRVDIFEVADEGRPPGAITAPASTPDRFGIGHQPSTEAQQAVQAAVQARQQGIDITPAQARELGQEGVQRLINIEKAIAERPQIASIREPLQQQVFLQARGDFGQRRATDQTEAYIREQIKPMAEQLKQETQASLLAKQQQLAAQGYISTIGPEGSYKVGPEFRPLTTEEQRYTPQGAISAYKPMKEPSFQSKLAMKALGTGITAAGATLLFEGLPKAKKAIPYAAGFGLLEIVAPPVATAVAIGYVPSVVKGLQENIAEKGILKTIAAEGPTFGLFAAASRAGIKARAKVKSELADISYRLRQPARALKTIEPEISSTPVIFSKDLVKEFRVQYVEGLKVSDIAKQQGFNIREFQQVYPRLSKPEFVKELPKQPDLIVATAKGFEQIKAQDILGKETTLPQPFKESILFKSFEAKKVLTPREALRLAYPRESIIQLTRPFTKTTIRAEKEFQILYEPAELKFGELVPTKPRAKRYAKPSLPLLEGKAPKQIGVTYKLGGFKELLRAKAGARELVVIQKVPSGQIEKKLFDIKPLIEIIDIKAGRKISIIGKKLITKKLSLKQLKPKERVEYKEVESGQQQLLQLLKPQKQKAKQFQLQRAEEKLLKATAKQYQPSKQKLYVLQGLRYRPQTFKETLATGNIFAALKRAGLVGLMKSPLQKAFQQQFAKSKVRQQAMQSVFQIPALKPMQMPKQAVVQKPMQIVKQLPFQKPAQVPSQIPIQAPAQKPAQDILERAFPKQPNKFRSRLFLRPAIPRMKIPREYRFPKEKKYLKKKRGLGIGFGYYYRAFKFPDLAQIAGFGKPKKLKF